jgi:hypothetical protein
MRRLRRHQNAAQVLWKTCGLFVRELLARFGFMHKIFKDLRRFVLPL